MTDHRWMLMARLRGAEPREYAAIAVRDVGWVLTRAQAEAAAEALKRQPDRFLVPVDDEAARTDGGTRPVLSLPPGEGIWHYGDPARVDLVAILKRLADSLDEGDRETVRLPVAAVVEAAVARFGRAHPREIEARFDPLVLALGGERRDDPPTYVVPVNSVLTGVPPPPDE